MSTLSELRTKYAKSPKTLAAINAAIRDHGENAEAVMSQGLPSNNVRSNLYKQAVRVGFAQWSYYVGARAGKNANDGNYNVIVKTS